MVPEKDVMKDVKQILKEIGAVALRGGANNIA